jgi:rhodanese-related sulfurtransferase
MDIHKPIAIVCDAGKEEESIMRLARVGYENVIGYLEGGFPAWKQAGKVVDSIETIEPSDFSKQLNSQKENVLDVRTLNETQAGHIKDAIRVPLAELQQNVSSVPSQQKIFVHCAGGYRSMIAASLLKQKGYNNLVMVNGGWNKIKNTTVPIEKDVVETV